MDEMIADGAAFDAEKVVQHVQLLRVFAEILNTTERENNLNIILATAQNRYEKFLNMLVSLEGRSPSNWPIPPWYETVIFRVWLKL
jgi:hypothetical protein